MRTTSLPRADRLIRASLLAALVAASAACASEPTSLDDDAEGTGGAGSGGAPSVGGAGPVDVVEGAPRAVETPAKASMDAGDVVLSAGVVHGAAAFGTEGGLRVGDLTTGALTSLSLFDVEADTVGPPGAVSAIARRPGGGAFVASEEGLLHDQDGVLLRSPLDAALDHEAVTSIDARAAGEDAEELWIAADGEGVLVNETIVTVTLEGLTIERLVGVRDAVAIAAVPGALVEIDVEGSAAVAIAAELGAVHDAARAEDGTVWFATDAGLVRRAADGTVERWTLAAAGEPAAAVHAVTAAFGAVVAMTDAGLIGVDAEGPFTIDAAATATDGAHLAIDGAGDTWLAAGSDLTRYATGAPVTFAGDVAPLLATACTSCHEGGVDDAPRLAFDDYDAVVELAPSIAERITKASSPMPPTGLLAASETAPILRWIATGMAP